MIIDGLSSFVCFHYVARVFFLVMFFVCFNFSVWQYVSQSDVHLMDGRPMFLMTSVFFVACRGCQVGKMDASVRQALNQVTDGQASLMDQMRTQVQNELSSFSQIQVF
jgi:hypothetical protein